MNQFEMVAIIVTVAVLAGVLKHYFESRSRRVEEAADNELLARLAAIEKRLGVLESIVTSDGYDLKQRFRDLERD